LRGYKAINKKKVLIVEDEIVGAMFLERLLELWGYECCELATSGKEALKIAEREKPDIVLMDINLHGEMSGIATAEQIRALFGTPLIFLSGYSDEETKEKAGIVEPAGYFLKPVDYDKLRLTLQSIVRKGKRR
jgi:CheY-like chemotaxis protein